MAQPTPKEKLRKSFNLQFYLASQLCKMRSVKVLVLTFLGHFCTDLTIKQINLTSTQKEERENFMAEENTTLFFCTRFKHVYNF